ncbi:hypothetical protein ACFVVU_22955 [Kitasatospora sp. NPDC057965]|uniref:hypothetical protein n=1 Tax=Kitasatospora sp. NPDC057965 TaxID=3346291 RepID=UPI0036DFA46D
MYLIHARIQPPGPAPGPDAPLGPGAARALLAAALPQERIEHVVVHPADGDDGCDCVVLGVFLLAERLEDAECTVAAFCRRTAEVLPALRGWTLSSVNAPLVAPFYERLLDGSGPAGRIRPLPFSSSENPFHPF